MDTRAVICGAILAAAWTAPAYALRPFVGTDAAVAGPGELELELGYLSYLREGGQKSVIAPAAVVNLGLQHGNELVLEGGVRTRLNPEADMPRTTFEDAAISLKHVHREGVLQDADGPSIASECGVLIPTLQGERTGASCAGIVSVRWGETTVHFNGAIGKNREGNWEKFLGAIVAGPSFGTARPVFETFVVRDSAGLATNSALAGLLWTVNENLTFDVGLRKARSEGVGVTEIRAGLTWTRPMHH
jgi:hypothetical protein